MAKKKETTAGAFDIRNIIGALMTIYGVILVIWGSVKYDAEAAAKTGDINANLIVGIVLLCIGIFFLVWTKLRPQVVVVSLEEAQNAAKDDDKNAKDEGDVSASAERTSTPAERMDED